MNRSLEYFSVREICLSIISHELVAQYRTCLTFRINNVSVSVFAGTGHFIRRQQIPTAEDRLISSIIHLFNYSIIHDLSV
jgi:hypothetical protein